MNVNESYKIQVNLLNKKDGIAKYKLKYAKQTNQLKQYRMQM